MTLRILIAPAGFKESLRSREVADCIATGIFQTLPDAQIYQAPFVDGGEGFTEALVAATGGALRELNVTGPLGQPVQAQYGLLGGSGSNTAILEMASAAGLRLVPPDRRDPARTTTYGVGELISAALDEGTEKLLVGCGDSGTNDGGVGMAQALGVGFLDSAGEPLSWGGSELKKLKSIDLSMLDPRVEHVQIDVACNEHNLLCGPEGVARIYGAQKGASSDVITELEAGLEHFARVIETTFGVDIRTMPGGGASGGLGAGLHVFMNAELHHYFDIVSKYLPFEDLLSEADLVITAEGRIDSKTPRGKIPFDITQRAKQHNLPVIAISGSIGEGADVNFNHGIDAFMSVLEAPTTLPDAIVHTPELLTRASERLIRMVLVGGNLHT
jgi:glycerate kinase